MVNLEENGPLCDGVMQLVRIRRGSVDNRKAGSPVGGLPAFLLCLAFTDMVPATAG